MSDLKDIHPPSAPTEHGHCATRQMTLRALSAFQKTFDESNFDGADTDEDKRRHIAFHIGILAGKLFRIEERADHNSLRLADLRGVLVDEIIPDLLVYAAQLASLVGVELEETYLARLHGLRTDSGVSAPDISLDRGYWITSSSDPRSGPE